MPDPVVVNIPLVGDVEFPGSMSMLEIQQASARLHHDAALSIQTDPNRKPVSAEDFTPKAEPNKALDALFGLLPTVGGAIGGFLGGAPGAAAGGAAGQGYKELAQHAGEIPGALKDVASNLVAHPVATAQGMVSGTNRGAINMGTEGAVQGALEAGGAAAGKYVIQPAAQAVMRGYLKPSLAGANINNAREIVQTAIDEALPVTKGGEARAGRLIGELNADINSTLAKVKGQIDLGQVADRVRRFAKAKYFKPGVDSADYNAALAVADSIDQHAALQLPNGAQVTKVNATIGNDIKQAVRPPSRAFGQQSYVPETATRKVAGAEMRSAIERTAANEGYTDVAAMNAREGRLINAQDAIQRAAGREENKGLNPTAVPNLIAGIAGGSDMAYNHDPVGAAVRAAAIRAMLSPALMTRAAIYASKLARQGYAIPAAARAAVAMVQSETKQQPENIQER